MLRLNFTVDALPLKGGDSFEVVAVFESGVPFEMNFVKSPSNLVNSSLLMYENVPRCLSWVNCSKKYTFPAESSIMGVGKLAFLNTDGFWCNNPSEIIHVKILPPAAIAFLTEPRITSSLT